MLVEEVPATPAGPIPTGTARGTGRVEVLVLDAELRQALVAARSLGRLGLRVGLVKGGNADPGRLSAPSRYSRWAAWCQDTAADFGEDPDAYGEEVLALAAANPGCVVLPCSDGSLGTLRPLRRRLAAHARVAMAAEAALDTAVDKLRTLQLAAELSIPVPASIPVRADDEIAAALGGARYPVVVKPMASWVREPAGERLLASEATCAAEADAGIRALLERGIPAIVQPWLSGRRESVTVFRVGGVTVAAVSMAAARTTPVLGGASVVRETIPLDPTLRAHTEALLAAAGLDGYASVEFRRDAAGVARVMEINPRLEGSVEVPLRAGVDFPQLLWRWATGRPVERVAGYRTGVRMRWLTGDVRWLAENLRAPDRPDALPAVAAVRTFVGSFAGRQAYDFLDWQDPRPLVAEVGRVLAKHVATRRAAPGTAPVPGTAAPGRPPTRPAARTVLPRPVTP